MTQQKVRPTDGVVVVAKPAGMTSHDVVSRLRRAFGTRKVGHAGTLDPMATGVLVCGIERGTKLLTYLVGADKTYRTTIRLGISTVTDDREGTVTGHCDTSHLADAVILSAVAPLTGTISQVPSAVSAVKIDGVRAYRRVREGEHVDIPARTVTVHRFEITEIRRVEMNGQTLVDLDAVVDCSSGTYIRALARDLGNALGVGGHLTALHRAAVGPFVDADAATIEELMDEPHSIDLAAVARRILPVRELSAEETVAVGYGQRLTAGQDEGPCAALTPGGVLSAVVRNDANGTSARPDVVFLPAPAKQTGEVTV